MESPQVLEHVAQLRALFADHPLWTFLAIALAWAAGVRLTRGRARSGFSLIPIAAAICAIASYVAIAIWYACVAASYYDFAEPSVACIAWLFDRGQPIYHAFDAAERYAHMYGPLAFMIPGWFLAAIGPGIIASKTVGALAGVLSVLAVHRLMRSATTARHAIVLTGLFAGLCLMYRNASFWIRPDSFALLFAAISLLAATSRRRWLAALGVGLSTGVLVNLKLTGPLYALPAFALLASRFGIAPLALAATTTVAAAIVPFAAWPNVSLENYLVWVKTSAGNGLLWPVLRHNIEWALFLLLPIASTLTVAAPNTLPGRSRILVNGALLLGITGVAIAASKPGAGPYHLMPFWPAVLYILALHFDALRSRSPNRAGVGVAAAAFALTTLVVAGVQQLYFIGVMQSADSADAASDVVRFADANPDHSIAMGYANAGERSTFVRPVLVFRSGRYPIDAPAVQEFEMSGLDLPHATIDALRRCDVEIWLIPKGATPFDGPNKYPAMAYAPLFPDAFKQAFFDTYSRTQTATTDAGDPRDFDVWRCRHGASRSSRSSP